MMRYTNTTHHLYIKQTHVRKILDLKYLPLAALISGIHEMPLPLLLRLKSSVKV